MSSEKAVSMMTEMASSETATPFFFSAFDTSSILLIPFDDKTYITIHSIFMSNLFISKGIIEHFSMIIFSIVFMSYEST